MMNTNFKKIKNIFDSKVLETLLKENKGNKHNDLKKIISENEILKKLYIVYDNIKKSTIMEDNNSIKEFLEGNLQTFKNYKKHDIIKECNNIAEKMGITFNDDKDDIFEAICLSTSDFKLRDLEKRIITINKLTEKIQNRNLYFNNIKKNNKNKIKESEIKSINEWMDDLKGVLEKYSFLNEEEYSILESFLLNDVSKKQSIYESLVNENLNLIKRKIFECDEDDSLLEILNSSKEKLENLKFNEKRTIEDYVSLLELKKATI